jgi:hypothetical protein
MENDLIIVFLKNLLLIILLKKQIFFSKTPRNDVFGGGVPKREFKNPKSEFGKIKLIFGIIWNFLK